MKLIREALENKQIDLWFDKMIKEPWFATEIIENIDKDYNNYDFGKFQYYHERNSNDGLVISVKGKGYPTKLPDAIEKELVKKYPKLKGFDREVEKGVEKFMSDFFESLFWDDVRFETENFDFGDLAFTVTGRSGGYWGVTMDSFENTVKWEINKNGIKKLEKLKEEYIKGFDEDETIESYEDFIDDFMYETNYADSLDLSDFDMDKATVKLLDDVEKTIEGTVKYFEGNERWLEEFDANEYWENIIEYIDIDITGEEE